MSAALAGPSYAQIDVGSGLVGAGVGAATIGRIAGGGRGAATGAIVGGSVGAVTGAFRGPTYYAAPPPHCRGMFRRTTTAGANGDPATALPVAMALFKKEPLIRGLFNKR